MADLTSTTTITEHLLGGLKIAVLKTSALFATGDTIDLASDAANAIGVKMDEIIQVYGGDDVGAVKVFTFVPATGIITAGTITTGIHHIIVFGR